MQTMDRAKTIELLNVVRDAALVVLADIWPFTYLFIENVTNERIYAHRADAMMFLGMHSGEQAQIWRSVKAIEGEEFIEDLEAVAHFSDNASHVSLHLQDTHIDKRPRFRRIAGFPIANHFVSKVNKKHGNKLATQHLKELEEFHSLVLNEATSRNINIGWTDHDYPPPNAGSAPLQHASKFSVLDVARIELPAWD